MKTTLRRGSALSILAVLFLGAACEKAASQASAGSQSDSSVVARVGEDEITLAEVDEKGLKSNMSAYQALYNARREALEELVAEALLDGEARSRGITRDELVAQEISPKIPAVTQEDIEKFYNENQGRLAGQTLEQIGGQIRDFLVARNDAVARQGYLAELRGKTTVDVSLSPPRTPIEVARGERFKGPWEAAVTIVEYSDFQ